jgi:quinolinate synthase
MPATAIAFERYSQLQDFEVRKLSDYVGSTETIIRTIAAAPVNTRWLVGTELNLVNCIAEEFKPQRDADQARVALDSMLAMS